MINLYVKNLGIIKEAKLNIKPFTIFIGENNTNKSWVAYSLYGILHEENIKELTKDYLNLKDKTVIEKSELKDFINDIVDRVIKSSAGSIEIKDIRKIFDDYINILLRDLSKVFSKDFIHLFFGLDKSKKLFEKTEVLASLSKEFKEIIKKDFINSSIDAGAKNQDRDIVKFYKGKGEDSLILEVMLLDDIPLKHIKRLISDVLLGLLARNIFGKVLTFPSERKALATFSERLQKNVFSKISKDKDIPYELLFKIYLKKAFDFPILLEDFIKFVPELRIDKKEKYYSLINYIRNIIGGTIVFDEFHEYITFIPKGANIELPVYSTSSMVKSLSTFYLYLEKLAKGRDLVILDEPEMNLHPKAQAEFLELLTAFVNGIDKEDRNFLIATTHTPYILEHLENLLLGYKYKKDASKYLFLKNENSFISSDNVAIYLFSNKGEIENVLDKEKLYIDWKTFSKIATEITEIGFNIEEKF